MPVFQSSDRLQEQYSELANRLSDGHIDDSVIFTILTDLYIAHSICIGDRQIENEISAESLFADFSLLAQSPSLRVLTLWAEMSTRVSLRLSQLETNKLTDAEIVGVEEKFEIEEFQRLIVRFPGDAAELEEQLSVYRLIRDKGSRSDYAIANVDPRYTVLAKLGSGWFGSVYLAWDEELDRDVAIKVPYPTTLDSDLSVFRNEARNAAQLQHENIVRVIDFAQTDSRCYIIYEYVRNAQELDVWCKSHRPKLRRQLEMLRQISSGLAHAHYYKIVHRDLKPANILVSDGQIRLADFGLSTNQNKLYRQFSQSAGTLGYMSPEQLAGEKATEKSDIFSFGVIAQEMFRNQAIPFRLRRLIQQCLQTKPALRPDANTCLDEIQLIQRSRARQRPVLLASLAAALTICTAGGIAWRSRETALQSEMRQLYLKSVQYHDAFTNAQDSPRDLGLQSHAQDLRAELERSMKYFQEQSQPAFPLFWNTRGSKSGSPSGCIAVINSMLLNAEGEFENSLTLLASAGRLPNSQWQFQAEVTQGDALFALRRWTEAYAAYQRAVQLTPEPRTVLRTAVSAQNNEDTDQAIAILLGAISKLPLDNSDPQTASHRAKYLSQLSEAYRQAGKIDLAIKHIQESVNLFAELSKKHDDYKQEWAITLLQLATLQTKSDALELSLTSFTQCEVLLKQLVEREERKTVKPRLAQALMRHSTALRTLSRFEEALALATEADSIYASCIEDGLASDIDQAATLLEMASCQIELQKPQAAIELMTRAEAIYRESQLDPSSSLFNLGVTLCHHTYYLTRLNPDVKNEEAILTATEAIEVFEKLKSAGHWTDVRQQELARAYQLRSVSRAVLNNASDRDRELALADAQQAKLALGDTIQDAEQYAWTLHQLAVSQRTYDPVQALPIYNEAIGKLRLLASVPAQAALAMLYNERAICNSLVRPDDLEIIEADVLRAKQIATPLSEQDSPQGKAELHRAEVILQAIAAERLKSRSQ